MDRDRERDRIQYMLTQYDYQQEHDVGIIPTISELLEIQLDERSGAYWSSILRSLAQEGLLTISDSSVSPLPED